jgi:methionyl-tRNA formyltransferase
LKSAPKLTREHCRIDWNQDITIIHDKIRGLAPHPGAFTELPMMDGRLLFVKVFRSSITHSDDIRNPGKILTDGKTFFNVTGRNGLVQILELQPAGRKPLKIGNFLNGFGKMFI